MPARLWASASPASRAASVGAFRGATRDRLVLAGARTPESLTVCKRGEFLLGGDVFVLALGGFDRAVLAKVSCDAPDRPFEDLAPSRVLR